jgi:hypothetical protein
MLRDHSFRKANISIAVAAVVMFVGFIAFGRSATDVEYQLLIWGSFAAFFVSLFVLYRRESRLHDSRSRSAQTLSDGNER